MKSTPAMRARIRELMGKEKDDYDRAVECVLNDIEALEAQVQEDTIHLAEDTDVMEEATTRIKAQRARIEALEAALQQAYDFLQDKAFTPDSLTHECTKVVEQIEAALAPEQDK